MDKIWFALALGGTLSGFIAFSFLTCLIAEEIYYSRKPNFQNIASGSISLFFAITCFILSIAWFAIF